MDESMVQEILHELFSAFERQETQSTAILQFLKDKGIASDDEFAPYLERAGNASGVRWLAARVRIDHLISGAIKAEEEKAKQQKSEEEKSKPDSPTDVQRDQDAQPGQGKSEKQSEKDATDNREQQEVAASGKAVGANEVSDREDPSSQDEGKNGSTPSNSTKTSEKAA